MRADKPPHEQKELLVAITEKACSLRCLLDLCHLVRGGEEHLDVPGIGVVSCSNGTNHHGDSALSTEVGSGPRNKHNGACKVHGKAELPHDGLLEQLRFPFVGVLEQRFQLRRWRPCCQQRDLAVLAANRKSVPLLRYRELLLPEPGAAVRTALVHAADVERLSEVLVVVVVNIPEGCLGASCTEIWLERAVVILVVPIVVVVVVVVCVPLAALESREKPALRCDFCCL